MSVGGTDRMEHSKQPFLKRLLSVRGMGAALTAFAGLIIIYIAFGLINPTVFSGRNIVNLTRSMSKYLIIGIGQSYLLITGNIDLSIGSVVGMSDGVYFEVETAAGVESAFHEAVDDYLSFCKEKGKQPEKSYKGSFNVRINPDLHRAAALAAAVRKESLNQFVADAIAAAL